MANPLQLPSLNINPGYIPPGQVEPGPIDKFITSLLEAKQAKGAEDERKARMAMQKQALDMAAAEHQAKLDEAQHQRDLEVSKGKAGQQLLKIYGDALGSHAANTGQIPTGVQEMVGPPAPVQNAQQGQQPAQTPNGPQQGSQGPMQAFSQIVSSLPPEAVGDFIKSFRGMAQDAQGKVDQGNMFEEADRLTAGLLTPQQRDQMKVARVLAQAGAPKEVYSAMLPQAQMDLAKTMGEVKAAKSSRDADKLATAKLVQLGLLPRGQGLDEYVVVGATKQLVDYIADVRKDARIADRERTAQDRTKAVEGLEGTALEIASSNPDWTPAQIKAAIRATPAYHGLPDGVVAKAALEAPKKARALTAPGSETQAKIQTVYAPARAALAVLNAMDAKGARLGWASQAAQVTSSEAGKIGLGTGAGIGGAIGNVPGGIVGGLAGGGLGLIAAPVIRFAGKKAMSDDEQRLFTAAQNIAAAVYRPESGASVTNDEIRTVFDRYLPLSTDKPGDIKLKRVLRDQLDKTLASVSGLPRELAKPILDALLSKQEQSLTNGTSW